MVLLPSKTPYRHRDEGNAFSEGYHFFKHGVDKKRWAGSREMGKENGVIPARHPEEGPS